MPSGGFPGALSSEPAIAMETSIVPRSGACVPVGRPERRFTKNEGAAESAREMGSVGVTSQRVDRRSRVGCGGEAGGRGGWAGDWAAHAARPVPTCRRVSPAAVTAGVAATAVGAASICPQSADGHGGLPATPGHGRWSHPLFLFCMENH
jgi:hypothetical protein